MSTPITRHFINVGGRRVHYRRSGSGPALVMLHGSPGDSEMLLGEIAAASPHFTVFALDTPGFGFSQALPGEILQVSDLARATAEAMQALGLPPCPVYGTHTGAAIAIELGVGWPERVTGLIMEGLPAFTEAEIAEIFQGYFAPMVPDPLGGHLISTWVRFRDQFTWFPWPSRNVKRLNPYGRATPADIHQWVSMFYRSCGSYKPAYYAACHYGPKALVAASKLSTPAIYTATVTDMLHPHLERLPPLKPGQRVAPLPVPADEKNAALVSYFREFIGAAPHTQPAPLAASGQNPAVQFYPAADCLIYTQIFGNPNSPALILAHDAPGSAAALIDLARSLAEDFFIVLPDLPGCGNSTAPHTIADIITTSAQALRALADHLALPHYSVLGVGCGAAIAARHASLNDPRLQTTLLQNTPVPNSEIAKNIAPDITLAAEGTHWVQAWLMVRDSQIYAPWYAGTVETQLKTQGNFDAQWLHDQTIGIMSARQTYQLLPRAAWQFDSQAALSHATKPVHILPEGNLAELIKPLLLSERI